MNRRTLLAGTGLAVGAGIAGIAAVHQSMNPEAKRDPEPPPVPSRPGRGSWRADAIRTGAGVPDGVSPGAIPETIPEEGAGTPLGTTELTSRESIDRIAKDGDGTTSNPFCVRDVRGRRVTISSSEPTHVRIERSVLRGDGDACLHVGDNIELSLHDSRFLDGGARITGRARNVFLHNITCTGTFDGTDAVNCSAEDCHLSVDGLSTPGNGIRAAVRVTGAERVTARRVDAESVGSGLIAVGDPDRLCDVTWTESRTADTERQGVYAANAERLVVSRSTFRDSAAGARLLLFSDDGGGGNVRDSRVHHCTFAKETGDDTAGNECCETFPAAENVRFDHNWVATAVEDAFEHAYPVGGCSVEHCVADDCAGQIVDIFGAFDAGAWKPVAGGDTSTRVRHIYGRCTDVPVLVTDADGVVVSDVSATGTRNGCVTLEQRNGTAGETPANCLVAGPLPTDAEIPPVTSKREVGPGNAAGWYDDGILYTYGPVPDGWPEGVRLESLPDPVRVG